MIISLGKAVNPVRLWSDSAAAIDYYTYNHYIYYYSNIGQSHMMHQYSSKLLKVMQHGVDFLTLLQATTEETAVCHA